MDKSTEIAHKRGMIPLGYYNQLNGKSAQENYEANKEQIIKELLERKQAEIDKKELEAEISQIIEDKIQEIFKGLKFSL